MNNSIAVLITCHNRIDVTIRCLSSLYDIRRDVDVFCVDDNSDDGTYETIKQKYPQVYLFHGDGNLFWCRGMRKAWIEARRMKEYDFYLWLNDDMELYPYAFDEIFDSSEKFHNKAIVSGLVQESKTKDAIYGGYDRQQRLICANGKNNDIFRLNGNFVLIPKYVFERLGFFDEVYHHDIGDVDYGFMAHEVGIPVVSTKVYIGSTKEALKNNTLRIRKSDVNIVERFKKLYSPLGAPPFIHYHFIKKHYGIVKAVLYFLYLHIINILPDSIWNIVKSKK